VSEITPLVWTFHADQKKRSQVIAVIIASCLLAVVTGSLLRFPALGAVGAALIFASTMEAFTGCKYRLDSKQASRRVGLSVSALEWTQIKRVVGSEEGILLSPLPEPSTLEAFRGVFLVMPYHMRTSVEDFIRGQVTSDVRFLGFGSHAGGGGSIDQPGGGGDSETEIVGAGDAGPGDA
jgi:hypothetical protein